MSVDTLTSIKVFRTVVEMGTFVAAAERLDMSNAMVSRHVMHVERRLRVRLLNRNSRTLSLTEAGRVYYERCKTILDDLETTELELGSQGDTPRGTLRITAPTWVAGQRWADLLAEYRRRCPEVVVDMSFEDRIVDLVEEGYDLALRVVLSPDSLPQGLIARPVARPTNFCIAGSREYLKRMGTPKRPEDLEQHDFVAVGSMNSLWFAGPNGRVEVPLRVVLRYRSVGGAANAVAAGIGLAPVPGILFEDPHFANVLVPVVTEHSLREISTYFVYASRKYVPLKIRTFVDFIVDSASRMPPLKPVIAQPGKVQDLGR
jgi:DNA-binding transcriptional LysR family regulator